MELFSIEDINELYLLYTDRRSIRKWLMDKGLQIIKLGRKYFVSKTEFEALIQSLVVKETTVNEEASPKAKLNTHESTIYKDLLQKLTEL